MSSFFQKIKEKTSRRKSGTPAQAQSASKDAEPTYSIQPHPARTNDPADLQPNQPGGGLRSDPVMGAHNAKGPYVPDNLPPALNSDDYARRTAELNK
ncbi:hypothetical protein CYLTODRAFT_488919 [Cylindrobasidium torrendii FP15055 ss-10]|uniref:Uncharacterized protein n=1 Tax=Cylindrobasidium torrendii FP15055 ss-10 TaxID=1314674 RepID=A0A0D7BGV6_9AGAR|nr:hypothetical protein CYLTODRAFT_488919 [Cylindrobasidium torrendii FP15055 ss-10]